MPADHPLTIIDYNQRSVYRLGLRTNSVTMATRDVITGIAGMSGTIRMTYARPVVSQVATALTVVQPPVGVGYNTLSYHATGSQQLDLNFVSITGTRLLAITSSANNLRLSYDNVPFIPRDGYTGTGSGWVLTPPATVTGNNLDLPIAYIPPFLNLISSSANKIDIRFDNSIAGLGAITGSGSGWKVQSVYLDSQAGALTLFMNDVPPTVTSVSASANQIKVSFDLPVTASNPPETGTGTGWRLVSGSVVTTTSSLLLGVTDIPITASAPTFTGLYPFTFFTSSTGSVSIQPGDVLESGGLWANVVATSGTTVYLDSPAPWATGSVLNVYAGIPVNIEWTPDFGSEPGTRYHWREFNFLFKNADFTTFPTYYKTDLVPVTQSVTTYGLEQSLSPAEGAPQPRSIRVMVPLQAQRGSRLVAGFKHNDGWRPFSLEGTSITFTPMSERTNK